MCLGFDLKRSLAQKVEYSGERLAMALDEHADPTKLDEELQSTLQRTKFHHWAYEEEVRVFVQLSQAMVEGSLHFWPFDGDLQLSEVILGYQCDLAVDSVRELVRAHHPHAVTFRARLALKSFGIVPNERTVP